MPAENLDHIFQALADPTRRAIVSRLSSGETASLGELAEPFDMSLPGVMKHVGILENAGLVEREKIGRTVFCRLNAAPMAEAIAWLEDMEQFWSRRLDALADHIEGPAGKARRSRGRTTAKSPPPSKRKK